MSALGSILVKLGIDPKDWQRGLNKASRDMQRFSRKMSFAGSELTRSFTLPILAVSGLSLKAFADIEKMKIGLEAVMGSSSAAAAEFDKLNKLQREPGLQLQQVLDASIALQSMGIEAGKAREIISGLGRVTAFSGKGADEFGRAFEQLRQIISKVNIEAIDLKLITSNLPAAAASLKSAFGAVDAETIRANNSMAEFVNKFTEANLKLPVTDKMANTLANTFENFMTDIKLAGAELGEFIVKQTNLKDVLINDVLPSIRSAVEWFGSLSDKTQGNIIKTAGLVAVLGPLLKVFSALISIGGRLVGVLSTVFKVLSGWAVPILAIIAGLGKLSFMADNLGKKMNETWDNKDMPKWMQQWDKLFALIIGPMGQLPTLLDRVKTAFGLAKDEADGLNTALEQMAKIASGRSMAFLTGKASTGTGGLDQSVKSTAKEVKTFSDILKDLKQDLFVIDELAKLGQDGDKTKAIWGAIESAVKELGLTASSPQVLQLLKMLREGDQGATSPLPTKNLIPTTFGNPFSNLDTGLMMETMRDISGKLGPELVRNLGESARKSWVDILGAKSPFAATIFDTMQGIFDVIGKDGRDAWAEFAAGAAEAVNFIGQVLPALDGFLNAFWSTRTAQIDAYYENQREKIENSRLTEEQKAAAMKRLDKEVDDQKKKIARQQAIREKAINIFSAIINTARAVAEALPNVVLAAIVGALGAAQIGAIAAQPIPALAEGGVAFGQAMAIVGEYPGARSNPEVIAPLDKLQGMMGRSSDEIKITGGFRLVGEDLYLAVERVAQNKRSSGFRNTLI